MLVTMYHPSAPTLITDVDALSYYGYYLGKGWLLTTGETEEVLQTIITGPPGPVGPAGPMGVVKPVGIPAIGGWLGPATGGSIATAPTSGNGLCCYMDTAEDFWFDAYRYEIATVAGVAGSKARAFIMNDAVSGGSKPGTKLWSGAQVAADAIATVETVISPVLVTAGRHWYGLVFQQITTPIPQYRSCSTTAAPMINEAINTVATGIVGYQFVVGNAAQDVPAGPVTPTVAGSVPRLILRRCAAP